MLGDNDELEVHAQHSCKHIYCYSEVPNKRPVLEFQRNAFLKMKNEKGTKSRKNVAGTNSLKISKERKTNNSETEQFVLISFLFVDFSYHN